MPPSSAQPNTMPTDGEKKAYNDAELCLYVVLFSAPRNGIEHVKTPTGRAPVHAHGNDLGALLPWHQLYSVRELLLQSECGAPGPSPTRIGRLTTLPSRPAPLAWQTRPSWTQTRVSAATRSRLMREQ